MNSLLEFSRDFFLAVILRYLSERHRLHLLGFGECGCECCAIFHGIEKGVFLSFNCQIYVLSSVCLFLHLLSKLGLYVFSLCVVAIVVYDILCGTFSGEWAVSVISTITIIFLLRFVSSCDIVMRYYYCSHIVHTTVTYFYSASIAYFM